MHSGSWINPAWFALDASRGYESPESKHFMRGTVAFWEALIFVPAVLVFAQICYGKQGYLKKVSSIDGMQLLQL